MTQRNTVELHDNRIEYTSLAVHDPWIPSSILLVHYNRIGEVCKYCKRVIWESGGYDPFDYLSLFPELRELFLEVDYVSLRSQNIPLVQKVSIFCEEFKGVVAASSFGIRTQSFSEIKVTKPLEVDTKHN